MRLGISDHLGWAIAVTASGDHEVVDRRRIQLVEPGITAAPLHYESSRLDVAATAALVARVRASVAGVTVDEGPSDRARRDDRGRLTSVRGSLLERSPRPELRYVGS